MAIPVSLSRQRLGVWYLQIGSTARPFHLCGPELASPSAGQPILILGNGPTRSIPEDLGRHAWHIRFNNCPSYRPRSGDRVDELVLVNCGGQPEEWLSTGRLGNPEALAAAVRVTLPIHPGIAAYYQPVLSPRELREAAAQDHTWPMVRRLRKAGHATAVLAPRSYRDAVHALGQKVFRRGMPVPSSGFLLIHHVAQAHPRSPIHLDGFGFAGWEGHPWQAERAYCERLAAEGRLTFV